MTRPFHRAAVIGLSALALLALMLTSCESSPPPNVLWIVWDTVRADRLGVYGHDRDTTPNLDRWAADARVFEDCLSTAGYTLPSHASMFTGLLPSEHCTNNDHGRLDDDYTTIAEHLGSYGYRTYLSSANPQISSSGNFNQGFDRAEHPWSPRFRERAMRLVRQKLSAEDTSSELGEAFRNTDRKGRMSIWNIKATGALAQEAILSWLGSPRRLQPFFVFVNYMEAHRPLIPPRRFRERMMSPEQVERSYGVNRSWAPTWEYTCGVREYDDEEIELTRATYDAAVAELDGVFGRLVTTLKRDGYLENTVVILTSDHGEHLGEQHMLDHQYSVYQPLLRVPLIIHYPPRIAPGRDSRPVVNYDIFPTLLDLIGIPPPVGLRTRAVSLLEPQDERTRYAEDPSPSRVAIASVKLSHPDWDPSPWKRQLRALVEGDDKLIWGSDGRHELFDLSVDPMEQRSLLDQRGDLARSMRESLDDYRGSLELCDPGQPPPDLTPAQVERLKALGYIGG
jgi:arylsulfatase A-like enzyme